MASLLLTYLLWMFGGVFGLHHLYLGRVYHAFVWFSTFGGVFGLGWARELWRIPYYVRSSNADKEYQKYQLSRIGRKPRPNSGLPRFIGMFVMGFLTSTVLCGVLPNYEVEGPGYPFYRFCSICLTLVGSSIGVYIVANVGELQCTYKYPVIGACISIPWLIGSPANITMAATLSTLVTWWAGLCWKPMKPLKRNRGQKLCKFLVLVVLWTSVMGYGFYYNATISIGGEERIPLRVALGNFFSSPAWRQTKDSLYQMYLAYLEGGWDNVFDDASDVLDFSGQVAAFNMLGLNRNASQVEITKKCRKLSAQFHPDKFKTETEKEKAQEKFIEIQASCSTLSRYTSGSRTRGR